MRKALIEKATRRLCQVADQQFPVAPGLEWRDCADDVTPETHNFDGAGFVLKPPPPAPDPRLVLDAAELAEARQDAAITSLLDATPAQRIAWARANFPSLTLAEQNRLGMILNILAVAVRPHVR